jgi:hypothetical protein
MIRRGALFEKLVTSFATLRTWQEYLRQQLAAATTRAQEQEAKLRTLSGDDAVHAQIILDSYRQRENDLRRALDQMLPLERLLRHFRDDFEVGARIPSPNGCATARQRRGSGSAGSGTTRLRRSTIPTKPPTAASSPSRAA